VVKVNIFLTDMANFAAMNSVYAEVFNKEPKPVRTVSFIPFEVEGVRSADKSTRIVCSRSSIAIGNGCRD
jgi:hypothetical protein